MTYKRMTSLAEFLTDTLNSWETFMKYFVWKIEN